MVRHIHNHPHIHWCKSESTHQPQLTRQGAKECEEAGTAEIAAAISQRALIPQGLLRARCDLKQQPLECMEYYIYIRIYIYVHIVIWYIYIWNVWNEMRIHANSIVAVHKSLTRSTFHFWRVLRYGPEEFQVFYFSHEMIWAFPFVDLAFSFKLYTTLHN